jgi:ABC-type sugar transport system permease subunit
MLIYLAGLLAIPSELYEAAKIDGAKSWHCFRCVTWPMLYPTTLFILIVLVISSMRVFGPVYVMTRGGPVGATSVMTFYLYREGFEFFKMGSASAVAYILFVILLIFTIIQWRIVGKRGTAEYY